MMVCRDEVAANALAEITRRVDESRRYLAEATPQHDASVPLAGFARPDETRHWFACICNPKSEQRAALELRRKNVATFLPMADREGIVRGRKVHMARPLFPRYLFLGLDRERGRFHHLRGVQGLESLVRVDGRPAEIQPALLASLWEAWTAGMFDERRAKAAPDFLPGQAVRVMDGPFREFIGTVARAKPGKRVEVLLSIFGRPTTVRVERNGVEAV